ncbi:von Willebrand factor type A domain protein [Rubripirellula lacrimiformis]|uniref:von Willebrand factor type A domain protein n=1 Tax=Rubripirellula lacrimiformis TaxID=1930273 RepID=A0A517NBD6_9BACT|nr:VWA domain-containing protein [Rubripirellula lacrimiformis]QDT04338.1 von Willebrand factor type A domain protein [Rubripirellula lacrimiformis]
MNIRDIEVGAIGNLVLLGLVVLVCVAGLLGLWAKRRAIARFATPDVRGRLLGRSSLWRDWSFVLLSALTMALLVLCLVDIRWGQVSRSVPQKGIELMFVLDVSRSMLAEDVTPNRLQRAKQMIRDVVDEMAGDRVGLVLFAGEVKQQIPMTSHYDDFKERLDEVGVEDIVRGGSRLGDAIRVAATGYLTKTNEHKAMVLLTDGDDMESAPIEAAKAANAENGVTIFTIGLGDLQQGARIPVRTRAGRDSYMQYDGEQVWSKLNQEVLSKVATATGGAYIPAGVKQVDMASVYHGYISAIEQQEFETAKVSAYEARFAWFLVPAIALMVLQLATTKMP